VLWRVTARLLKPLGRVEGQALSLEAGDFTVRTPEPEVRELIPVVRAMNRMAEELSQTFSRQVRIIDELQRQVSQDPVTGLNNRQTFEQRPQDPAVFQGRVSQGGACHFPAAGLFRIQPE
jgi:HAMP domain.